MGTEAVGPNVSHMLHCTVATSDLIAPGYRNSVKKVGCDTWTACLAVEGSNGPGDAGMVVATATVYVLTGVDLNAGTWEVGHSDAEAAFTVAAEEFAATGFDVPAGVCLPVTSIAYLYDVAVRDDLRRLGLGTVAAANLLHALTVDVPCRLMVARPWMPGLSVSHEVNAAARRFAEGLGFCPGGEPVGPYQYGHTGDTDFVANLERLASPSEEAAAACLSACGTVGDL